MTRGNSFQSNPHGKFTDILADHRLHFGKLRAKRKGCWGMDVKYRYDWQIGYQTDVLAGVDIPLVGVPALPVRCSSWG